MITSNRYFHIALALVVSLIAYENAHAYKLIPISVELTPSGKSARQTFRIENTSNEPIAVELKMYSRNMTPDGKDILKDAENDFVVFPAQAIVMPGKTQAVRLQWIGDPNPEKELAFRMICEQLPISFDKDQTEGGQVRLLVRFIASIYVAPRSARPDIVVTKVSVGFDDKRNRQLVINITNKGTAHSLLRDPVLALKAGRTEINLATDQIPELASQNLLAGHSRKFLLPWPKNLPVGAPVAATLSYRGK